MLLYNISDDSLKYWREFDELGNHAEFEFAQYDCWCGEPGGELVSTTSRHRNQFNFVKCAACGTIRINPYLTDEGIEKYYLKTYGEVKRHNVPPEKLYKKQAKSGKLVLSLVEKFISKEMKILDFGAGAGGKMNELLVQGYNVYIKEVDQKHFEYGVSKGLKPFHTPLKSPLIGGKEKNPPSYKEGQGEVCEKFDFIFLSRIVEHMNEPVKFLESVKALLAPKGHIYIEVPLIENARDGYLLNEFHISHKWYFSVDSLKAACALAGLTPVHESRNLIIVKVI